MNDMAIERAMVAKKLDTMQNELEATLSQDEIDTLSDAIVLSLDKNKRGGSRVILTSCERVALPPSLRIFMA